LLVFTRKRDEVIVIGDGIRVQVLRVGHDQVRLGVSAPLTVPVHRLEVYEQIEAENRRAASGPGAARSIPPALAERLRRPLPAGKGDA